MPTFEIKDKWLNELSNQWNCNITTSDELDNGISHEDYGLIMKKDEDSQLYIGPICNGEDYEEASWNMLENFIKNKYCKIADNKAIAILFVN